MTLPRLYAIVDAEVGARAGWTPLNLAHAYLNGGVRLLQLRAKTLASGPFLDLVSSVSEAARTVDARVIVNDRADLAVLGGASGVHVGQTDLPLADVRRIVGAEAVVGLSTHTSTQIDDALRQAISYLAIGPVFGTSTKATGYEAVGLKAVRDAVQRAALRRVPVVAIGGMTLASAPGVIEAGAASVAVIGDLLVGDPEARARQYLSALA